jgi:arylamine N-acetyltransferase
VPYENVSKWRAIGQGGHSGQESFDFARYVYDVTAHGLGGTCFRLALGCFHLLRGLGEDAALVTAPAGDHAAVLVNAPAAEGGPRLVDVGFFAPFWEPLPLDRPTAWAGALGAFTVTPGDDGAELALRRPSGTTRVLSLRPVDGTSVWRMWADSCAPGHPLFPRAVILQRQTADTAWSLFDRSLHTVTAAGLEQRALSHDAARAVVRDRFEINPDVWQAAMAVRERLCSEFNQNAHPLA